MAEQAMENRVRLYLRKIRRHIGEIRDHVWSERIPVAEVAVHETRAHLTPARAARLRYRPVEPGFRWGEPGSTAWFRLRGSLPRAFAGEAVHLRFDAEGECLAFRGGRPVQGLDAHHKHLPLTGTARTGERVELYIEAGANNAFGTFEVRTLREATLAVFLPELWDALHDLQALFDLAEALPESSTRRARLVRGLNRAVDLFAFEETSRAGLRASARRIRRALKPLLSARADASAQTVAALGHAHIDVAWLWPLAETRRKVGRTFSTVLSLLEQYPAFVFVQSQPQLYEYARETYPGLFRRIREAVKAGRWIPTGCMWVEADCNLPSGESLVRQVLHGTRYLRETFGAEPDCLFLPDVFGYNAALPQILRRSGIRYFLTQKISWSQFTTFPYHSFRWEGLDGSRVLAHFPPANDYNSRLDPAELRAAAARYREKDRSPLQAVPFGHGDGGGGPTAGMLERLRRYADCEGMPKLEPMAPGTFFDRLEAESEDLPVWVGELYLELHRATLTTQGPVKTANRRAEFLLRDVEFLAAVNAAASGAAVPSAELDAAWKTLLLNQFHDIIPGSSVAEVYADAERDYAEIDRRAGRIRERALAQYARRVDTRGDGAPVVALNTLPFARTETLAIDPPEDLSPTDACVARVPSGETLPVQRAADGRLLVRALLPSMGHATLHLRPGRAKARAVRASRKGLENDRLRVDLDREGRITRIRDKTARREVLPAGARANRFQLFRDKPVKWDAWDTDIYYADTLLEEDGRLLGIEAVETGPVRAVVRVERAISRSRIRQEIILTAGSPRIDFVTEIDWGDEKEVLLKAAFPVEVRSAEARYEIQFGHVARPTHGNTPRDFARFEVAAHRWADLSEPGYGVALLNDGKYGHDTRGNVLRLTLLRAPKAPDPGADVNRTHRFTYALLPHAGDGLEEVIRAGYALNAPPLVTAARRSGGSAPPEQALFTVRPGHVVLETVKPAEDDPRAVVLRLYEAAGARGRATIATGLPVREAVETDLMEREETAIAVRNGRIRLAFRPFQIRTLLLRLARD
jgi:alpha-mannosidase